MITRRKDYSKQLPSKDARKLYLFCEGEGTEPDYFTFFKGLSRLSLYLQKVGLTR